MDITFFATLTLISVGLLFCGYLLGYNHATHKLSLVFQTFINTMISEGIIDKVKMKSYYKRGFNIELDFKELR